VFAIWILYSKVKETFLTKNSGNIEKWKQLKDKYEGKIIFIAGNESSLNKVPLHLLENEHAISFNRFNL